MRKFSFLCAGQAISLLGSGLTSFALGIWVFERTGSVTKYALIFLLAFLPRILVSPVAGLAADRFSRKAILLLCDGTGVASMAALAGLYSAGMLRPWHIYLTTATYSLMTAFQLPAFSASVPLLVPKSDIGRANGLVMLAQASPLVAPVLAGALLASITLRGVLVVDAASFLVNSAALLLVRIPRPARSAEDASGRAPVLTQWLAGWRYIAARRSLLSLMGFSTVVGLCVGSVEVLFTPVVLGFASVRDLGIVLTVGGCGVVAGSSVMAAWGGPSRTMQAVLGFTIPLGLALCVGALRPNVVLIAAAAFVFLSCEAMVAASMRSIWQVKVEPGLQGRVLALTTMVNDIAMATAYACAGLVADHFFEPLMRRGGGLASSVGHLIGTGRGRGVALLVFVLGVVLIASAAGGYLLSSLRRLDELVPDAIAGDEQAAENPGPDAGPAGDDQRTGVPGGSEMSVLVVGLSHKTAPLATLERVAFTGDALDKLLDDVCHADGVTGALVLSTCSRVEAYAEAGESRGAAAAVCELLSRHAHVPLADLKPHLYVRYQDRAVQHLLAVACGLDSMVIGESQILGQLRQAMHLARERGTLGRALADLGSLALRAGKRAQSQTSIGAAGASLVSAGLQLAARHLTAKPAVASEPAVSVTAPSAVLNGQRVLVVGAGAMSGLAAASVTRAGAASLVVTSRTMRRAQRLAASAGGRATRMSGLVAEMAKADLVVTCTGASGHVITVDMVAAALRQRASGMVFLDLAMPRDVDPAVTRLAGVTVTDLETLATEGHPSFEPGECEVGAVRRIIAEEFACHVSARRAAAVTPTVVALRAKAARVVDTELARVAGRLDRLDAEAMEEIARSMRRVTDKLLHDPTVRVKELAGASGAGTYEDALCVLFDLDPAAVRAAAQAGWPEADGRPAGEDR